MSSLFIILVVSLALIAILFGRPERDTSYARYYSSYGAPYAERQGDKSLLGFFMLIALGFAGYYIFMQGTTYHNKGGPMMTDEPVYQATLKQDTDSHQHQQQSLLPEEEEEDTHNVFGRAYEPTSYTTEPSSPPMAIGEPSAAAIIVKQELPLAEPTGTVYIQVGAFRQLQGAQSEQRQLLEMVDKPVQILTEQDDLTTNFKVLVGPFATRSEANTYRSQYGLKHGFLKDLAVYSPRFLQ